MKSLIESLGQSEIQTVVAQLQAELCGVPLAGPGELQDVIANMPLALFIKDADSRIVLMNPACEALWGVTFAELRGKSGLEHFPTEQMEVYLRHDRTAFVERRTIVAEEQLWHAGRKELRCVQTHKRPLYDQHGKPRLLIAMSIDITDSKLTESTLASSLQQVRALSEHQQSAKNSEHRRLARDIHDDLSQNLLALKLDLSMLLARTGQRQPRLHQRATLALDTLNASIAAARDLINELHPTTLELGLSAAIEWQIQQLERRQGLRCKLQLIDDSAVLDQHQTDGIFSIVQTALAYISGHSGVRQMQVSLNLKRERLAIVVSGDGQPARDTAAGVFDLSAIRERLASFGGELAVAQLQGAGTVLSLTLPGQPPAK